MFGLASLAHAQDGSTIELVAIDADISGNDATTLGALDGCLSIEPDETATVDLVVDAVPEDRAMIGFQIEVTYDPTILEAIDAENAFLLAAEGAYQPIEGLSDPLPDSDGHLLIVVADAASDVEAGTSIETGEGVISRVTFRPISSGISTVGIGFDPPDTYPAIIDPLNTTVQVDNIGSARIAVGEDCPADSDPEITPLPSLDLLQPTGVPTPVPPQPVETDSELNVAFVVVAAVLGVVGTGALGSGWLLLRRRNSQ